ncbi:hypothetical protein BH11VER1_BH11VER1_26490 [soil metagenome]
MASSAENKAANPGPSEPTCHWPAWVLSSVSVGLLSLPLALSFWSGGDTKSLDDIRKYELREAAAWPIRPKNAEALEAYPKAIESYVNDHFALRDVLVSLHHGFKYRLGISPVQNATIGKDGWLFYSDPTEWEDVRGLASISFVQKVRWCVYLNRIHDSLGKQGIPFLFVIAPDKSSIYPEYLPGNLQGARNKHRLNDLLAFLKENHCRANILDLRDPVLSQKALGALYYKLDTHWNNLGAAFGARQILLKLRELGVRVKVDAVSSAAFDYKLTPSGDLMGFMHQQGAEMAPFWKQIPDSECEKEDENADLCALFPNLPAKSVFRSVTRSRNGQERLLLFRDSFSVGMVPSLAPQFAWTGYVWEHPSESEVINAVQKLKPTVVVWETLERTLWLLRAEGPNYDSPRVVFDFLPGRTFEWSKKWRDSLSASPDVTNLEATDDKISAVVTAGSKSRIYLKKIPSFGRGNKMLHCKVESPGTTTFIIRGESSEDGNSEKFSWRTAIHAGENDVLVVLPEKSLKGTLRIEFGDVNGKYEIHQLAVRTEIPSSSR